MGEELHSEYSVNIYLDARLRNEAFVEEDADGAGQQPVVTRILDLALDSRLAMSATSEIGRSPLTCKYATVSTLGTATYVTSVSNGSDATRT